MPYTNTELKIHATEALERAHRLLKNPSYTSLKAVCDGVAAGTLDQVTADVADAVANYDDGVFATHGMDATPEQVQPVLDQLYRFKRMAEAAYTFLVLRHGRSSPTELEGWYPADGDDRPT